MDKQKFKAERTSKSASFTVNANIKIAFPLFGAFEERKWAEGWNPRLIYPDQEIIEVGTTFKTEGNDLEPEYLWRVIIFNPAEHLIQYLVSTTNRYWTIEVKCTESTKTNTKVTVTYTYLGLNKTGNALSKSDLSRMFKNELKDWENAINTYLQKAFSL